MPVSFDAATLAQLSGAVAKDWDAKHHLIG
jgi:hypothetical protein